jgi:hypothetical protein
MEPIGLDEALVDIAGSRIVQGALYAMLLNEKIDTLGSHCIFHPI